MKITKRELNEIIAEELAVIIEETTQVLDESEWPTTANSSDSLLARHLPHLVFKTSGSKMPPERQFVPNVRTGHTKLGRVLKRLSSTQAIAKGLIQELELLIKETEDEIRRHKQ